MEKFKKPMLIACGGLIILVIFMFIISSCQKKNYTSEEFVDYLLAEAKNYYSTNSNNLPSTSGKTSLNILTLIDNQNNYLNNDNSCSGSIDVLNNNGNYLYIPNITCADGYVSKKISDYLISDKIVTSGNGLYQMNNSYIYRGDDVDNYLIFNGQLWRIVGINEDGTLRIIETNYSVANIKNGVIDYKNNKRSSAVWDNRYNIDKNYTSGFNDFIHEGLNSRIKDTLEDIYNNEYTSEVKAYISKQDLCIGKRAITDTINDGSIECSTVINDQYIGLLQVNEYINASLDSSCISAESVTCSNYNYLSNFKSTYWSITAVKNSTYEVYKIGRNITDATASSSSTPRIVINLSNEVRFSKGDGTESNPYIIN